MIKYFTGAAGFQSSLDIEEVGKEISKCLFGGLSFGGLEDSLYEEIPAIYIDSQFLGLRIILCGYQGIDEGDIYEFDSDNENYYILDINDLYINPRLKSIFPNEELEATEIDDYLEGLLRYHFLEDKRFKFLTKKSN